MTLTGLAFAFSFFGCLAWAAVRNPIYGLYAYIAVFYLHPPSRWWGNFLPDLRWSLLAGIVTLVLVLLTKPRKDRSPWYANAGAGLLVAYALWLWIQSLWALDSEAHLAASVLFTKYILLFYVIYQLVDTPADLRRVLWVHFGGCVYLGWLALGSHSGGRLEGVGGPGIDEANALAMQLDTGAMVGAMLLLTGSRYERIACILGMPLVLNGIVLTGSRGAFLALVAAGLVLAFMKPPSRSRLFYGLAALGLVLFAVVASQVFWERMRTITVAVDDPSQMDTSAESRLVIAAAQWQMTLEHPFGSGHRGTAVLSPLYIEDKYLTGTGDPTVQRARSSHNTFMTALSEQGFIGAVMFLLMWGWVVKTSVALRRSGRRCADEKFVADLGGIAAALAAVFVAGIFVDYLKAEVQVWLVALLAAAANMRMPRVAVAKPMTRELSPATQLPAGEAQRR